MPGVIDIDHARRKRPAGSDVHRRRGNDDGIVAGNGAARRIGHADGESEIADRGWCAGDAATNREANSIRQSAARQAKCVRRRATRGADGSGVTEINCAARQTAGQSEHRCRINLQVYGA